MFGRRKKDQNEEWVAGAQQPLSTPVPAAVPPPAASPAPPATKFSLGGSTPGSVQVWGSSGATQEQIDQAMKMAERFTGRDLNGDGQVSGAQEDVVGQLERLAALRQSGALTEAEFQAEKLKIIGS